MNIVALHEADEARTHFADESEVTESDLRSLFDLVWFIAAKQRGTSLGAALVYQLQGDDRFVYFNEVVLPLWEKMGLPIQGKPPFEAFEGALVGSWRAVQKRDGDGDLSRGDALTLARERLGF